MLVLFRPSPKSIFTAYLASRVLGAKPTPHEPVKRFYFEETMDPDQADYDALYREFKEKYGGLDFLEDDRLYEIVEDEVFWASRYRSPDRYALIFEILSFIERNGTRAYLNQESAEAKEMKDRVRRVTREFRRAKGYIGFEEDERNRVMIGRASLEHDIEDLVLRHFSKKWPGYAIVLMDEEQAHICYDGRILTEARKDFPDRKGSKGFGRYWTMLSDEKHLTARLDPRYSEAALPRNYWKWVGEGTREETVQPKVTLEDFGT
jgi:hypothetical protein